LISHDSNIDCIAENSKTASIGLIGMLNNFFKFTHTECIGASSIGETITWIEYKEGIRTLYVAKAPEFKPLCITCKDAEKGKSISEPYLSPMGQYIIYTCREVNNDGSDISYLVLTHLANQAPYEVINLPAGKHCCFDEKNKQLFYVQDGKPNQLISVSLSNHEFTTLWSTQGEITALTLNACQNNIALCCQEETRSYIALYDLKSNQLQWISPNFNIDAMPVWSPSGDFLAFIRYYIHTEVTEDSLPNASRSPFSLMLYDVKHDKAYSIWDSRTSIVTNKSTQVGRRKASWLNNNELIFCHEGNGWEHVYRINIHSRVTAPLSSGDFLVRDLAVCQASQVVYISCNKRRRHHYQLESIELKQAQNNSTYKFTYHSSSNAMEFSPLVVGGRGRYVAFLQTAIDQACQIIMFDKLTGIKHVVNNVNASTKDLSSCVSSHAIKTSDDKMCYGQLFKPVVTDKAHPAVLYLHDGPGLQSLPAYHPCLEMSFHYEICQYLAAQGFIVFALNYRGSGGYNKGFREAKNRGWQGASEYIDVLAAAKWMSTQSVVDKKQIGIMGKGWGGYLAALGLARDSQLFYAGVDIHGYHHFPRALRNQQQCANPQKQITLFTCTEAEEATRHIACAKLATEHSPWDSLEDWMSPVLLVHGDNNRRVHFTESQLLYQALVRQGVNVETLVLPGEEHTFIRHQSWLQLAQKTYQFFKENLL